MMFSVTRLIGLYACPLPIRQECVNSNAYRAAERVVGSFFDTAVFRSKEKTMDNFVLSSVSEMRDSSFSRRCIFFVLVQET